MKWRTNIDWNITGENFFMRFTNILSVFASLLTFVQIGLGLDLFPEAISFSIDTESFPQSRSVTVLLGIFCFISIIFGWSLAAIVRALLLKGGNKTNLWGHVAALLWVWLLVVLAGYFGGNRQLPYVSLSLIFAATGIGLALCFARFNISLLSHPLSQIQLHRLAGILITFVGAGFPLILLQQLSM